MNCLIIGAGGIGLYFAARLAQAGNRVTVVARGAALDEALKGPLTITSAGTAESVEGIRAIRSERVGRFETTVDLVIVAVKSWQVGEVAELIAAVATDRTVIIPMQNGIDAAVTVRSRVTRGEVLGCTCVVIAKRSHPWAVELVGAEATLEVGALRDQLNSHPSDSLTDGGVSALKALRAAGITVRESANIERALWRKLMLISSYGGVGALSRQPVGVTSACAETAQLVEIAMREVAAVATAAGVALGEDDVADMMAVFRGFAPSTTASMQRDLLVGKPSELADQSGAVVRIGESLGVRTPVHFAIYASQLPAERAARRGD